MRKKTIKILGCGVIWVVCSLGFPSCSAVAVNMCQDARPLEPGRVQINGGLGVGLDYAAQVLGVYDKDSNEVLFGNEKGVLTHDYAAARIRVGAFQNVDFSEMAWLPIKFGGYAVGSRTAMTLSFTPASSPFQWGILPAFIFMRSEGDTGLSAINDNYFLWGAELPFIFSYDVNKHVTPYLAVGYGYNQVGLDDTTNLGAYGITSKYTACNRISVHAGVVGRIKRFSLTPELGVHMLKAEFPAMRTSVSFGIMFGFLFPGKEKTEQ